MRPTADCELWIDGEPAPCSINDLKSGLPTALTGLSITWGRSNQLEQPDIATCTVTLRDESASSDALEIAHVGVDLEVYATGEVINPITESIFRDGGFEQVAGGAAYPTDRYRVFFGNPLGVYVTTAQYHSGAQSIRVTASGSTASREVYFTPLPWSSNPQAWDSLPQMAPGDSWAATMWVKLPVGSSCRFRGALTDAPDGMSVFGAGDIGSAVIGTGAWQQLSGDYTNNAGRGYAWPLIGFKVDLPAATPWSAGTGVWTDHPETWQSWSSIFVDDLVMNGPPETSRRVLVFSGEVTDVIVTPADDDVIELELTAADIGAALENDAIGDDPWPVQSLQARADRITSLAHLNVPVVIDTTLTDTQVSYRDVDSQPVLALLQDLADSVAATLWTATHGTAGSYFWMEDPDTRVAVRALTIEDTGAPPTLDATNLAMNPSLESGVTTGWGTNSSATSTIAIDSTAIMSGTYSVVFTRAANPDLVVVSMYTSGQVPAGRLAVTPGLTYTASLDLRPEQASRRARCYITWYDAGGASIGNTGTANWVALTANQTTRLSASGVAPANAASIYVVSQVESLSGNAIVGERVWYDQLLIMQGTGTAYFDGDTAPVGQYTYNWTGTQQASTSERWLGSPNKIVIGGANESVTFISASDILRDPVKLTQTVREIITQVSVSWLEQTLDEEGKPSPTERITQVIDSDAQTQYGKRRLSITTDLISQADAVDLGNVLLARSRRTGWRADSYTWATGKTRPDLPTIGNGDRQQALMDLLDGGTRIGRPITLIDLPEWMPTDVIASMYLEGGTYSYSDGAWTLELTISPSQGQGESATWQDIPATSDWEWRDWDTSIRWIDLYGVAGPTGS